MQFGAWPTSSGVRVAIIYALRISTKKILATVHAVVSSMSQTKVSFCIFILGLFYLSFFTLSIQAFSFLHSRFYVSSALCSCSTLCIGQLSTYFVFSSNYKVPNLHHKVTKLYRIISSYLHSSYTLIVRVCRTWTLTSYVHSNSAPTPSTSLELGHKSNLLRLHRFEFVASNTQVQQFCDLKKRQRSYCLPSLLCNKSVTLHHQLGDPSTQSWPKVATIMLNQVVELGKRTAPSIGKESMRTCVN